MNQYLAIIRTNLDDLPMGLFDRLSDARTYLCKCTEGDIDAVRDVMDVDTSDKVCGVIVEFYDGAPTELVWREGNEEC